MALPAGRRGVRPDQVKPDGTLNITEPIPYELPVASADTLGGVKVGSGLSIADGVLSSTLPTASADTLGGVKVGSGLSIADGVLSSDVPEPSVAEAGKVLGVDAQGDFEYTEVSGGHLYMHAISTNQYSCLWLNFLSEDSGAYDTYAKLVAGLKKAGYIDNKKCFAVGCGREPANASNVSNYFAVLSASDSNFAGFKYDSSSHAMTQVASVVSTATITDNVTQII